MEKAFVQTGRIKVLFLDINGTLLDPDRTFREAFRTVWEDTAGRWDGEEKPEADALWKSYESLWRKGTSQRKPKTTADRHRLRSESLARALDSVGIRWKEAAVLAFFRKVREEQVRRPYLYPGAADTLKALAQRYRLAVISNGGKERLLGQLKAAGLLPLLGEEHVYASSALGIRKPGAGIFRKALVAEGIGKRQAVMIGNSWKKDVLGAVGAGMDAVWLHPGHPKISSRRKVGSCKVLTVRNLEQLPDLL